MRLIQRSGSLPVPLRLIGGTAVWFHCPSAHRAPLDRTYGDIDFVSLSKNNRALTQFFESNGYEPERLFNALHGAQRLNFTDPKKGRPVDVLLDRFVMCHTLELANRLTIDDTTIPLTDLLVTKAQVVELNEKDVKDIVALVLDHEVGKTHDRIELARLAELTNGNWGLEHTIRKTLQEVQQATTWMGLQDGAAKLVVSRIAALIEALDHAPKSPRWRIRARVGERVRWYLEPEEARR
ncbi:MAG: hypothetical protein M3P18_01820 [Actinomycetota bacterium]|nr:hypothetical protein [Actinomycetota bacterium]